MMGTVGHGIGSAAAFVRIVVLVVGIGAWWLLAGLGVQRALSERPKYSRLGTPALLVGLACLVLLLLVDFLGPFTGLGLWFLAASIGHFLLVMTPIGLWVVSRRRRMGWPLGPET